MSDPMKSAQAEAKSLPYGTVEFLGTEYEIKARPNALLLSELARTGTGDPEAMGVMADFFEVTLGTDAYRQFRKAAYKENADEATLFTVLQKILEKTMGRPTE